MRRVGEEAARSETINIGDHSVIFRSNLDNIKAHKSLAILCHASTHPYIAKKELGNAVFNMYKVVCKVIILLRRL